MSMLKSRTLPAAALASTMFIALGAAGASAQERTYTFDIADVTLSDALRAYARITGQQIIFTNDLVAGRNAPTLKGAYSADDALASLLKGTGLTIERTPSGAIMVRRIAAAAAGPATAQAAAQAGDVAQDQPAEDEEAEEERKVERVVVTGTHIRGKHPKSSPLDVYTKDDIERSGATTTEQFIQKVPQNLGTRSQFSSVRTTEANYENVNGVDLRGLGVGTTLTLLNGRRLGLASNGQAVDISSIPLGAIERVEILTDGASAIYGSDAIGGVVNFIFVTISTVYRRRPAMAA